MNTDTLRTIFQSATSVIVGGGVVQLLIFLLKRKSDIKALDAKADADTVNSQTSYITTLQAGEKQTREELSSMRHRYDDERVDLLASLNSSKSEVARLSALVGRVEADLAVARAQIAVLTNRLNISP